MNDISTNATPLVSVITIVKNGQDLICRTIKSVLRQNYKNIEYIIIDGDSKDQTTTEIKKFRSNIAVFISEPDKGISDAFNKGLANANGDWICFLNSGDYYRHSNIITKVINQQTECSIITGFSTFGRGTLPRKERKNTEPLHIRSRISHQASFTRQSVFKNYGGFDTSLKHRMDYDFWMRVLKKESFLFIPEIWVDYDLCGVTSQDPYKFYFEEAQVNKRYLKHYLIINLRAWIAFRARKIKLWR